MPHYQMWICPGLCLASRDRGSQLWVSSCPGQFSSRPGIGHAHPSSASAAPPPTQAAGQLSELALPQLLLRCCLSSSSLGPSLWVRPPQQQLWGQVLLRKAAPAVHLNRQSARQAQRRRRQVSSAACCSYQQDACSEMQQIAISLRCPRLQPCQDLYSFVHSLSTGCPALSQSKYHTDP